MSPASAAVRTFLIADVRGYTRFTQEYGDEAAARLASRFAEIVREGAELRGGRCIEIRGDEALVVFESARQAIRAAKDLQQSFAEESDPDLALPLRVGIGIDSGEAVELEDGSFRGNALNVAARLCGLAHGGEVLVSEGTRHLAGPLPGLRYVDRGRMNLKGISDPVHALRVDWEDEEGQAASSRWVLMFFGGQSRLGWKPIAMVVLVAAATAAAVVYLTTGDQGESGSAAELTTGGNAPATSPADGSISLAKVIPAQLWAGCEIQTVAEPNALETAVCLPLEDRSGFQPDRWQVSAYPDGAALAEAYTAELRAHDIRRGKGSCSDLFWGGETAWEHGPGQPGGHELCYFEGEDAVIVWTHERLDQPSHLDILAIAREGGSDHARLFHWWEPVHHLVGKAE